jgi:hypothetical protein
VQFESKNAGAEIVVITHVVQESNFQRALGMILLRPEVEAITCCLRTL